MSCITYLHNDPLDSGTKFISGTTCNGTADVYNLAFGDSVCMEAELPLVICDGLTISGSCDSPVVTPTPTQTPTNTSTPTSTFGSTPTPTPTSTQEPICPEQVELFSTQSGLTEFNGVYNRLYSYTGGSFNYVHRIPGSIWLFDTPDSSGNYGVAYGRVSGSTYYTLFANSSASPSPGLINNYAVNLSIGNYLIGSGATGNIVNDFELIGNIKFPKRGLPANPLQNQIYVSYPEVCPTPTPTPTSTSGGATPTPTATPSPTPAIEIFTHGTVLATCSDFCNANYQIDVSTPADANFATLTIGDTIYNQGGTAGFVAYAATSTDTSTGVFRIAEINSSGVILGIYICIAGSCDPL